MTYFAKCTSRLAAPIALAIGLLISTSVSALTITSQIGGDGSNGIDLLTPDPINSLSRFVTGVNGGFISVPTLEWTHNYVVTGNIISATFEIDIIDSDGGLMAFTGDGAAIGNFTNGGNSGVPGPWRLISDPLDPSQTFTLANSFFASLADGSFTIVGTEIGNLGIYGINRAILTIETEIGASIVPVPAALPLFGTGLAVLGLIGWRRKRKTAA